LLGSDRIDATKAADILDSDEIDPTKAARIVDQPALSAKKSADILGEVEKVKTEAILEGVANTKVEGVIANMPEDRLVERLPEMSAEKLHQLTPQVLFDNLPSVSTEAITREVAPEVDAGCAPPTVNQVSADLAIYEVCGTRELAWAQLVACPVGIDSILGKFNTVRAGVGVSIQNFGSLPDSKTSVTAIHLFSLYVPDYMRCRHTGPVLSPVPSPRLPVLHRKFVGKMSANLGVPDSS
jgi:hypothetical protein